MHIEVSQKLLFSALQYIIPAVSKKSVIPILSGVKLHVEDTGLILTAANTGMMMQYAIPNNNEDLVVHNKGTIVIPSRYFTDIIRNMPVGPVKIEINGGLTVCIQSGTAIYNLNGMNPEEYPNMVKQEHCSILSLSNDHLKDMIKRVAFAVSSSEARPVLTGVSCEISAEQLRFAASNGILLSSQTTSEFILEEFDKNITIIIPGKHLTDFSRVLTNELSTTNITIGSNAITVKSNNLTMQSSLIEGNYPSIDRITPNTFISEIIIDTDTLLHALERVTLLSGESYLVNFHISTVNSIYLSSKTAEIGDVIEEIQSDELQGTKITISFSGRYMIDILRAIDCAKVKLKFSDNWKPIVVQPIDNPNSLFLITPIRTPVAVLPLN